MSDVIFYVALIWMTTLLLTAAVTVIRAGDALTRILALDVLTLVLTALLVLYSTTTETSYYLDAALLLALLSFLSSIAAARYYSVDRIF
ncbi:MAG: pH regulation protein F [Chloroflexia bacterium]|jgi:multisubunit Na+/H+ antiporter MnhF subunit|nr:pH regulation protein F [Chloroflexia bacterium]MDQ3613895.1 monovalent cation/H+ antiporter complex subunit F [Chloroflexota bacterium]